MYLYMIWCGVFSNLSLYFILGNGINWLNIIFKVNLLKNKFTLNLIVKAKIKYQTKGVMVWHQSIKRVW